MRDQEERQNRHKLIQGSRQASYLPLVQTKWIDYAGELVGIVLGYLTSIFATYSPTLAKPALMRVIDRPLSLSRRAYLNYENTEDEE